MSYLVKIIFGKEEVDKYLSDIPFSEEEKSINKKQYNFKTKKELNAFLKGIDEAVGWTDVYPIVE